MKAFSIFDDFPQSALDVLNRAGVEVDILAKGKERPSGKTLKNILEAYDIIFISTAQKMTEDMFENVNSFKIIGTASSGIDHICVPEKKKNLVNIVNATQANCISVAEHMFSLILALKKNLIEGRYVAASGKTKREMLSKPSELFNSTIGVVGAGKIASTILSFAKFFGMKRLCWTFDPTKHSNLAADGVEFTSLENLLKTSDVVSVNIPMSPSTKNLISSERISLMKENSVFVSTSRSEVTDNKALFDKARMCKSFGLGLDMDAANISNYWNIQQTNVIVSPHIAGGTISSRIRLFNECSENVVKLLKNKQ